METLDNAGERELRESSGMADELGIARKASAIRDVVQETRPVRSCFRWNTAAA
jgi:hypothetical protein